MNFTDGLKKMIQAHRTGENEAFTSAVREIIALERGQGHNKAADQIEHALTGVVRPTRKLSRLTGDGRTEDTRKIPLSKGDQFPLLEIREPQVTSHDIVLDHKVRKYLDRIIDEEARRVDLARYGLSPLNRVLFYGPPGCGKTLAAHVVASMLGWPLLYVRFDSVISSYLGETSANLRRVFDFGASDTNVLFFDEFDAIGKSRDIRDEVGELKRAVNSFLLMMDNYAGSGLIITATNHEGLLDSALWRRFDEVVRFPMPTEKEIGELLRIRLGSVRLKDFLPENLVSAFTGLSHSDITRICIDAIKHMILADRTQLSEADVRESLAMFLESRPSA